MKHIFFRISATDCENIIISYIIFPWRSNSLSSAQQNCKNKSCKFRVVNSVVMSEFFYRKWYIAACLAHTSKFQFCHRNKHKFLWKNLWQTNSELKRDIFCTETEISSEFLVWGPQKHYNSEQKFWAAQNCSEHAGFTSEIWNSGGKRGNQYFSVSDSPLFFTG